MTALALVLVAVAIVLLPGNAADYRDVEHAAEFTDPYRPPCASWQGRLRPALAGLAVAVGSIGLLGLSGGILAAAMLAPFAAFGANRLAERAVARRTDPSLALALDLTATALHAGCPLHAALALVVPVVAPPLDRELRMVSGLLQLGADPDEAWRAVDPAGPLGPVAVAGRRSSRSGARLADAFERLAADTRADLRTAAESRANRAGVFAMAPLGLCFLPAFICLGIVPVVVGIAHGITPSLS
ncbi:MAG: type II secretion system F family protein [Jatrophihabitantaceae bacterium]